MHGMHDTQAFGCAGQATAAAGTVAVDDAQVAVDYVVQGPTAADMAATDDAHMAAHDVVQRERHRHDAACGAAAIGMRCARSATVLARRM